MIKLIVTILGLLLGILTAPAMAAENGIGVVVLHSKWDSPNGHNIKLIRNLKSAGFLVEAPEMTWSGSRGYDTGVDGMAKEITAAADKLREQGAKKIFLVGHSLGAAGAVRYATQVKVDGLVALAPGHNPEGAVFKKNTASSIAKAKEMVAKGEADEKGSFLDLNTGSRSKNIRMKASVYLEFMDSDGPMNFRQNAAAVQPGIPVLWVVGASEAEGSRRMGQFAFDSLPKNPPPKFVEVPGEHLDIPDNTYAMVIDWIKEVAQ
jgi:pimeloyl-ACP methyl ester carboxylesterase